MSNYTTSYAIAYQIPKVQQQIEVAVVVACGDIFNEDPATPDHTKRLAYANYSITNSSVAWVAYRWPVANNPTIRDACINDPSGSNVQDTDVQFVVNSNLGAVIASWTSPVPPV